MVSWTAYSSFLKISEADPSISCYLRWLPRIVQRIQRDPAYRELARIYRIEYEYDTFSSIPTGNIRFLMSWWFEQWFPQAKKVEFYIADAFSRKDWEVTGIDVVSGQIYGKYNNGQPIPEDMEEERLDDILMMFNFLVCLEPNTVKIGGFDLSVVSYTDIKKEFLQKDTPVSLCDSTYVNRKKNEPCRVHLKKKDGKRVWVPRIQQDGDTAMGFLSYIRGYGGCLFLEASPLHYKVGEEESRIVTAKMLIGWANNQWYYPVVVIDRHMAYSELILVAMMNMIFSLSPGDIFLFFLIAHGGNWMGYMGSSFFETLNGSLATHNLTHIISQAEPGVEVIMINESCELGGAIFDGTPGGGYIVETGDEPTVSQYTEDFTSRLIEELREEDYHHIDGGLVFAVPEFDEFPLLPDHRHVAPPSRELQAALTVWAWETPFGSNDFSIQLSSSPVTDVSYFDFNTPKPWALALINTWTAAELEYEIYLKTYPNKDYRDPWDTSKKETLPLRPAFTYSGVPRSYLDKDHFWTFFYRGGDDRYVKLTKHVWSDICSAYGLTPKLHKIYSPMTLGGIWSFYRWEPAHSTMPGFTFNQWFHCAAVLDRSYDDGAFYVSPDCNYHPYCGNRPSLAWGSWVSDQDSPFWQDELNGHIEEYAIANGESPAPTPGEED